MNPDIRYYFEIIKFTAQGDETIYANTRKLVAGGVRSSECSRPSRRMACIRA